MDELKSYPPPEKWDDWVEYDPKAWPRKVEHHYMLVPTICFNCEAACGLLAYIDKQTMEIRKIEGNPAHPGSRGRTCAKGPATLNQVQDPERVLYPMKRVGPRGGGRWERTTWDAALEHIGGEIRKALVEGRPNEVMYHVGRPGHDGYMDRVLQAWGIDGHNSHTNVCSSSARVGYNLWQGSDRPSPDHANARFILLISSHLETGHYFNPHAQRIIDGKMRGARLAVIDTRLSNTASMADYWLSTWPGTEAALLLAIARLLLEEGLFNRDFIRKWVNWEEYMRERAPASEPTFDNFILELKRLYAEFTPEFAARESRVEPGAIEILAREIARAGTAFSSHVWRSACSGNLGGWQVARALQFLHVLTGSVGTPGGVSPNSWNKFVPAPFDRPAPQKVWNELLWPPEYPLTHHEMSILLPHFLKEGRGRLSVYFTRVYNPIWTNPDGTTWMEVLRDEEKVGLHVALTPVWSETAWYADYVLPMGVGAERHDIQSQETHAARWIGFRQPVLRVAREKLGETIEHTYEANPGQVWEEDEFWIDLSWRIDPEGSLGIRRHFESPYRPSQKISVSEYYRWIFENSVPGLKEKAAAENLAPLEYMRKYAAFEVPGEVYSLHERPLSENDLTGATIDPLTGLVSRTVAGGSSAPVGVLVDGHAVVGFPTPSRKLEFYSRTLAEWGWPEQALPGYIRSHVHWQNMDRERGEYALLPTFRLPVLIHTRSGNAKWLNELAHSNPVWLHPEDARRFQVETGGLIRVSTDIGYFVNRVFVTEGIRPGVIACSHHLGRWRLQKESGTDRWCSALVRIEEQDQPVILSAAKDQPVILSAGVGACGSMPGEPVILSAAKDPPDIGNLRKSPGNHFFMRQIEGVQPFKSEDPDSERIWWSDAGVNQNLTFPVHPDPVSGMHCWHQKVRVERARPEDRYGDIFVDRQKSMEVYREWLKMTRPAPGPDGLRRPLWLERPVKPDPAAYQMR